MITLRVEHISDVGVLLPFVKFSLELIDFIRLNFLTVG